ncbi:MAG: translation elongation factor Ts [Lentisphaerae bacterium]|nr:translation elongation factor Ts [Lentisphaerota bacterium]
MTDISAALVKALREETGAGLMECKRSLVEAQGDKAAAIRILRERGVAIAAKKATRAVNQGVIASAIIDNGRAGSLIEVNCETDFVAKNPGFRTFVQTLAERAARNEVNLAEVTKAEVAAKIAEIGENIVVRRALRYAAQDLGVVAAYIHHGATIGVLLEALCQKAETVDNPAFRETVKDLSLQVAAANPRFLDRQSVPAETIAAERGIYAAQVKNKPPAIVDKIVDGKMNKFYEQVCLVDQPFIKDPTKTIAKLLKEKGGLVGDALAVQRFARFQVGEAG